MSSTGTEPETVGEKVYRRMRSDIIFGRLAPGQRLKLDRVRQDYGTSIGTLREMLNRLASDGLIHAEGMRGFEVAPVSAANLREVADMRLLLECHALSLSFAAGDIEWEARVVSSHHKLALIEKRMLSGDRAADAEAWKRYDWEFHRALISACGSNALLDTHAAIYDKYLRYQMIAVAFRGAAAAGEHAGLLRHALARDTAAAQATLATHIDDCVADTLARGVLA